MQVELTRLFCHGIRLAPGYEQSFAGELTLTEDVVMPWRRPSRLATLHKVGHGEKLLLPMGDATVRQLVGQQMTITGIETDPAGGRSLAQEWLITLPAGPAQVTMLYDDEGRPLPRHRRMIPAAPVVGEMTICDVFDRDHLRRVLRVARVRDLENGSDLLPPLNDAEVLWIGTDALTVRGMVLEDFSRRTRGQSWFVTFGGCHTAAPAESSDLAECI